MIEVKNLVKRYGRVAAVDGISFRVPKGEIVGFLGPNAAGKTTTMRILTGFSPPTEGVATVAGFDINTQPIEVKRRVGYLPENVPLYGEMLVHKFLRYVADVKGVPRGARRSEVERVMERCGLTQMRGRVIGHLSRGYRQRVGLAQALIGSPPVLILDEPTVGLDPKQIIEIRQMIKELAPEHTILLSTHILPEVAMICGRVIIIHEGRIVAQDTMENLAGPGEGALSVVVDVRGPKDAVMATLTALPGVGMVSETQPGSYRVEGPQRANLGEEVIAALVAKGFAVCGLRAHRRTIEDVFVEAIAAEKGGEAA